MQSKLSTQRLVLNLIVATDTDFIFSLVNSKGWLQFIGDRNVHSKKDAINYVKKIRNTADLFYWVVTLKENNQPMGIISFLKRSYLEHFDIGFAFLPQYNGYGYAQEAAEAVLNMVRKNDTYSPVLATTLPHNITSIKLLTKLGFHFQKEIQVQGDMLHVYSDS